MKRSSFIKTLIGLPVVLSCAGRKHIKLDADEDRVKAMYWNLFLRKGSKYVHLKYILSCDTSTGRYKEFVMKSNLGTHAFPVISSDGIFKTREKRGKLYVEHMKTKERIYSV